jgi:hypothetical protein
MGFPAMSANGLPGSRVEAIRAGMRTRVDMRADYFQKNGRRKWQKVSLELALIGVATQKQKT